MTQDEARSLPIVVDPDKDFLNSMKSDPQAKDLPPFLASTAAEALKLICRPGISVSAVFLNPDLQAPYSIKIIQAIQKHHPGSPIFFIRSTNRAVLSNAELEHLSVQKVIQKPATYTELLKTAKILPVLFDADEVVRIADLDTSPMGTEQQLADRAFFEVPTSKFVSGTTLLFNVYKKVSPGIYKKLFKAGETFDGSQFGGRTETDAVIHLSMNVHTHYLKHSNWLCAALIGKSGVPFDAKMSFTLWMGEQVVHSLHTAENAFEALQNAEYFIERLRELAQDVECTNAETLKAALLKCSGVKSEVIASMVSVLLVKQIDYRSARSYQVAGLASLLQNAPAALVERMSLLLDPSVLQTLRSSDKGGKYNRFKGTIFEIVESSFQLSNVAKKVTSLRDFNFHMDLDVLPLHGKPTQVTEAFRKTFFKFSYSN